MSRLAAVGPSIVLAGLILAICADSEMRPIDPHRTAAVFPPWWPAARSLTAATHIGAITGLGRAPFIVIVNAANLDASARAREAGALFIVDGARFGLCLR